MAYRFQNRAHASPVVKTRCKILWRTTDITATIDALKAGSVFGRVLVSAENILARRLNPTTSRQSRRPEYGRSVSAEIRSRAAGRSFR